MESGKRLVGLSRQARERKKLEQQQQAEESSFGFLPFYVIPISLAGVVGYWFWKNKDKEKWWLKSNQLHQRKRSHKKLNLTFKSMDSDSE